MRAGWAPRRRLGEDRGSVSTELVLLAPLLLLLILLGVQLAVWGLAQLAVQHAANHALQTTRVQGGTAAAGQADARAVLDQVAAGLVTSPQVTVTRTGDTATVTIAGTAPAVVPFLRLRVSTRAVAATERFRPDTLGQAPPAPLPPGVGG